MGDPFVRKIVLVVRETRLDDLIARFNTVDQARFYVEHLGADFSDYLAEHKTYREAVERAGAVLRGFGLVQKLDRRFLPNFLFGPEDGVVVLGPDGLVANTLKYLQGQRVVAVNPDPARWDGVLLPFTVPDLARVMRDEESRPRPVKTVTMARATLNTGQTLLAVNDLFIGKKSHTSARYLLETGGRRETQSSSGVIVSTGLGSTGWMRSLYAGWLATTRSLLGDRVNPWTESYADLGAFSWESEQLNWFVREPFPSRTSGAELVVGRIGADDTLRLVSQMSEEGVIFSDGIEKDHLEFNSGTEALVGVAETRGCLVV